MQSKIFVTLCLYMGVILSIHSEAEFIAERHQLKKYCGRPEIVMLASPGRSGSTMMTSQLQKCMNPKLVIKTHLLPPDKNCFTGKILFVYSNPDLAAESALFMTCHRQGFAQRHFHHLETADPKWLKNIGGADKQNDEHNLLSEDALGICKQLEVWLFTRTEPTTPEDAQILAVKYENLWDKKTVHAIRKFLGNSRFTLPPKRPRGHNALSLKEKRFKEIYNLGTEDEPRYAAYDCARCLWEQSPPFHFLKISSLGRDVPSCVSSDK